MYISKYIKDINYTNIKIIYIWQRNGITSNIINFNVLWLIKFYFNKYSILLKFQNIANELFLEWIKLNDWITIESSGLPLELAAL